MSIYLNNAATSWPKPQPVSDAVYDFIVNRGANVARGSASMRDIQSLDYIFSCRQKLAELFGGYEKCDPRFVTLTSNITESINIITKGFIRPGMRAVTSSMEHNSVLRPLRRTESEGISLEIVQCSMKGYLDPAMLKKAFSQRADIAIINHCSNVSGSLQNIADIAEVCRESGVPLVIDCAQTGGIVRVNAEELGAAAVCFTGHKGLFGPQGTGGIVWDPEFAKRCSPFIEGGTGSLSEHFLQPEFCPDRYESGTPNLPGIAGLAAGIEFLLERGVDAIRDHELRLARILEQELAALPGVTVYLPEVRGTGVVSFAVEGLTAEDIGAVLDEGFDIAVRTGLHCAPLAHQTLGTMPHGTVRISPGFSTTVEDLDYFLQALRSLLSRRRR